MMICFLIEWFQWSSYSCCECWLALCSLLKETSKMQSLWWYGS